MLQLDIVILGILSPVLISTILEKKNTYKLLHVFKTCLETCNVFGVVLLSLKLSNSLALIFLFPVSFSI